MKTSVLVVTIIAIASSLLMGVGAGVLVKGIGDINRNVGNVHQANDADSFSGMLVLAGLVQCAIGGFGGYEAYRKFGTKPSITWGVIPLVIAALVSISNTCSFFTSGVLFLVAALLTFLGSRQPEYSISGGSLDRLQPEPSGVGTDPTGPTLGSRFKAAGQLASKQAQRMSLATMALPSAYRALGKHSFEMGSFREEFSSHFLWLDNVTEELRTIVDNAQARPDATGITEKARGAALAAKEMAQTKAVELRRKQAFAALGEALFAKHEKLSGPPEFIEPIMAARTQIDILDKELKSLSAASSGQLLTPKRIVIAGLCLVVLVVLAVVVNVAEPGSSSRLPNASSSTSSNDAAGGATMRIDASSLFREFKANEVSANAKYQGRILDVQGVIDDIKVESGTAHVYLANGQTFEIGRIDCAFASSEGLEKLFKGQFIIVRGKCTGLFMNVGLEDCELQTR